MTNNTSFSSDEKYFLIRRLHSLTGFAPIGLFFLFHLFSNAKSLFGPAVYNKLIHDIHETPFLPYIEIAVLALPILFHAILGIVIYLSSKSNVVRYTYGANWRYFFQRISGLIALIYIGYHVWETRLADVIYDKEIGFERMQDLLHEPGMLYFYLIGALAVTYHFANGLWGFLITWGITISPRAQKLSGYVCTGLFFVLAAAWVKILLNLYMAPMA